MYQSPNVNTRVGKEEPRGARAAEQQSCHIHAASAGREAGAGSCLLAFTLEFGIHRHFAVNSRERYVRSTCLANVVIAESILKY